MMGEKPMDIVDQMQKIFDNERREKQQEKLRQKNALKESLTGAVIRPIDLLKDVEFRKSV